MEVLILKGLRDWQKLTCGGRAVCAKPRSRVPETPLKSKNASWKLALRHQNPILPKLNCTRFNAFVKKRITTLLLAHRVFLTSPKTHPPRPRVGHPPRLYTSAKFIETVSFTAIAHVKSKQYQSGPAVRHPQKSKLTARRPHYIYATRYAVSAPPARSPSATIFIEVKKRTQRFQAQTQYPEIKQAKLANPRLSTVAYQNLV